VLLVGWDSIEDEEVGDLAKRLASYAEFVS
jgi:hypothetical protein